MVGKKAYLVGGRNQRRLDIYDPETQQWTTGTAPPDEQLHHMQCVEADGKLWIVAAWTGTYPRETNANKIYTYDPNTDEWDTSRKPLPRQRGSAAVVVVDQYIYVSHGNSGGHEQDGKDFATAIGWLDRYDRINNSWKQLATAPNPRDHAGGAYVNGRICVAGGRNGGEPGWPPVAVTDCYDIATNAWKEEAPIPQPRGGSAYGTTCDGKLIVAGGETWSDEQGGAKAWANVDVFDGTSWTSLASLKDSRHGTGLAVDCECNQITIASGSGKNGGGLELKSVETWFPNGAEKQCVHT
jgi:N-acetylneuraminic acid mutarotase